MIKSMFFIHHARWKHQTPPLHLRINLQRDAYVCSPTRDPETVPMTAELAGLDPASPGSGDQVRRPSVLRSRDALELPKSCTSVYKSRIDGPIMGDALLRGTGSGGLPNADFDSSIDRRSTSEPEDADCMGCNRRGGFWARLLPTMDRERMLEAGAWQQSCFENVSCTKHEPWQTQG